MYAPPFLVLFALWAQAQSRSLPPDQPRDLFRLAVERALGRAQADLLRTIDLWVDHSRWEDPWVIETEHYQVRTTHSRFTAADVGKNLEFMHGEFSKLLGGPAAPARKFRVWIFPDLTAYNEFGQDNGAEHSSMYGAFYSSTHAELPVATYFTPNRTLLGMWVTHGAVHQYLEQSYSSTLPLWISEGLASYFALYWDWAFGARELKRIVSSSSYVPLERLMRDPIQGYVGSSDTRFIELGMFFHYLLSFREETRTSTVPDEDKGPFRDFLRAVVRGQDVSGSPVARMFGVELARIEEDFKSFDFGGQ